MPSNEIQTDIQSLVDVVREQAENALLQTQEQAVKNALERQRVKIETQRVLQLKQLVEVTQRVETALNQAEHRLATYERQLHTLTDSVMDILRLQQIMSNAVLILIKNGNTAQERKEVIDRLFQSMENIGVARGTVHVGDRTEFGTVQSSSVAIAEGDVK
jgi:hypothetical protein